MTAHLDGSQPASATAGSPADAPPSPNAGAPSISKEESEREQLLLAIQQTTRVPMIMLAVLMMALVCIHLAVRLPPASDRRLRLAEWLIWQLFIIEFAITFLLAPRKIQFLRKNWITALACICPLTRVLHVLPAVAALPGLPTFQILTVASRGLQKLAVLLAGRRIVYLFACTVVAVISSAVGEFLVEHRAPGANIRTYGDSVWWAAGTITSVGTELYPVTSEGRIIAVFTMAFGVTVVGYLAASIAALFVGVDASAQKKNGGTTAIPVDAGALQDELRRLEAGIDELKAMLMDSTQHAARSAQHNKDDGKPPR